jgi:hypothetical protein
VVFATASGIAAGLLLGLVTAIAYQWGTPTQAGYALAVNSLTWVAALALAAIAARRFPNAGG